MKRIEKMSDPILHCSCCGCLIRDNERENTYYGLNPYPCDNGFGMCVRCGGDKKVSIEIAEKDEAAFRRRIGWASEAFFNTRIKVLEKKLSPESRRKFMAMSFQQQVAVISRLIEKGVMI